ncbi:MAG: xanthine dehydrogenase accessory protein XdhC [Myxococcota bacterium]|nr:xanthine dehydrogenase accessory protein XdhC [Myxococcota bacterium]
MNFDLLHTLEAARDAGRPVVLATVIRVSGSTPRHAGSSMVIDASSTEGTIGGGAFEFRVIDEARTLLTDMRAETRIVDVHLVRDLGMCCGGRMEVFLEKFTPKPTLWIVGVGQTGDYLAHFASQAGFQVHLVPTPQAAIPDQRLSQTTNVWPGSPTEVMSKIAESDSVIIMTRDHSLDFHCVSEALDPPRSFVGMIGSRQKRERLVDFLTAQAVEQSMISRVRSPVGLDLAAVTPAEIALSIVGELVRIRRGPGP